MIQKKEELTIAALNCLSWNSAFLIFVLLFGCCSMPSAWAHPMRDSIFDPQITVGYAYHIPSGDMANRFGNNSALTLGFHAKFKSNWYAGVHGNFLFGNKVIQEEGFLQNLKVDGNYILDNDGQIATLVIQERGWCAFADGGRFFPMGNANTFSGLLVSGGVGFLQHKIRIEHQETHIQQLEGDYLKGYDRMTNGPCLRQSVEYMFQSKSGLVNFSVGVEGMQGFTQNRRAMNFDTGVIDRQKRVDQLYGVRLCWMLHLYRRMSPGFEDIYGPQH